MYGVASENDHNISVLGWMKCVEHAAFNCEYSIEMFTFA